MVRVEIRYSINLILLVTFAVSAVSGYILWFILPPGKFSFLGVTRRDWIVVHMWSSLIFTFSLIAHLVINMGWMVKVTKKLFFSKEERGANESICT